MIKDVISFVTKVWPRNINNAMGIACNLLCLITRAGKKKLPGLSVIGAAVKTYIKLVLSSMFMCAHNGN